MNSFSLSYRTVKAWAERLKLPFRANDDAGQIAVRCRLLENDVPLLFVPRPERDMLTVAITLPFVVKTDRFDAITTALSTLNVRSYMGAWILNPERGEVYFRVTLPTLETEFTDDALRFVARVVLSSAEAMAQPLYSIALDEANPDIVAKPRNAT
ncbi:MAG TPA: YbjN domain-containing protein [Pseudomonadota bacterium]|jgi:hypothetical protein|nr:YbjN domain-containing protein [Pseudomonadota bacterium]